MPPPSINDLVAPSAPRFVAIARELNLPIRYIGVGEKIGDMLPFDAESFVSSLFEG